MANPNESGKSTPPAWEGQVLPPNKGPAEIPEVEEASTSILRGLLRRDVSSRLSKGTLGAIGGGVSGSVWGVVTAAEKRFVASNPENRLKRLIGSLSGDGFEPTGAEATTRGALVELVAIAKANLSRAEAFAVYFPPQSRTDGVELQLSDAVISRDGKFSMLSGAMLYPLGTRKPNLVVVNWLDRGARLTGSTILYDRSPSPVHTTPVTLASEAVIKSWDTGEGLALQYKGLGDVNPSLIPNLEQPARRLLGSKVDTDLNRKILQALLRTPGAKKI